MVMVTAAESPIVFVINNEYFLLTLCWLRQHSWKFREKNRKLENRTFGWFSTLKCLIQNMKHNKSRTHLFLLFRIQFSFVQLAAHSKGKRNRFPTIVAPPPVALLITYIRISAFLLSPHKSRTEANKKLAEISSSKINRRTVSTVESLRHGTIWKSYQQEIKIRKIVANLYLISIAIRCGMKKTLYLCASVSIANAN